MTEKRRPGRPRDPGSKRSRGEPRHDPTDVRVVAMISHILAYRLAQYIEGQKYPPPRTVVVIEALEAFLRGKVPPVVTPEQRAAADAWLAALKSGDAPPPPATAEQALDPLKPVARALRERDERGRK